MAQGSPGQAVDMCHVPRAIAIARIPHTIRPAGRALSAIGATPQTQVTLTLAIGPTGLCTLCTCQVALPVRVAAPHLACDKLTLSLRAREHTPALLVRTEVACGTHMRSDCAELRFQ